MLKYLIISIVVAVLDQTTKWIASTQLEYHQLTHFLPYFDWYLAHNEGAAFSFLADQPGWQRWFLAALTLIISSVLLIWLNKLPAHKKLTATALALILGGAIGNVIDRIHFGYVVDFIQIWLGSYPWPSFNVADSFIFIGAVLLVASDLFKLEKNHDQTI